MKALMGVLAGRGNEGGGVFGTGYHDTLGSTARDRLDQRSL
jgi:hypothetical protein